ncbi:MAG: YigZ family protein [Anaerolineaceae bacterium 4572_32.2]|nr:MAG: YigZ family protein [Anaerolineaceae bacterium 4572_32.2]
MEQRLIPARQTRSEIRVANSRFIATVAPVFSVDEAKSFIARVRREFADAAHNVPAYIIGHGASIIAHCSDDGEPSGTAGPPALAVLRGSGLGDAAVVVTRYFGGTKLGTGGLVRAYGDAVREVLAALPRAVKIPTHTIVVVTPYNIFEQVRRLVAARQGQVLDEEFAAKVTVTARLPQERLAEFRDELRELSRGKIEATVIETNAATIMPITPNHRTAKATGARR